MKSMFLKSALLMTAVTILLAACNKEELQTTEPVEETTEQEIETGKLISATKTSVMAVSDAIDQLELKSDIVSSQDLFSLGLIKNKLIDFDIVTYRIKYSSMTVRGGKEEEILLTGDVSFIAERTGRIKTRHLESVTLFNTVFNTSKHDVVMLDNIIVNLRTIYNALVVFPFYQGGPDSDNIYAAPCEHVLKAKQAIDCELAALSFIESLENVEMMPDYYTENIGVSNGGGTALAIQYLLENDKNYIQYSEDLNLKGTFIGAGNCSNVSLMDNMLSIEEDSNVYASATCGYITAIAGAYYTWGSKYFGDNNSNGVIIVTDENDQKNGHKGKHHKHGIELKDYFTDVINDHDAYMNFLDFLPEEGNVDEMMESYGGIPQKTDWNKLFENNETILDIYRENKASLYANAGYIPGIKIAVNEDLLDEYGKFDENNKAVSALINAYEEENEFITYGWSPESPLKFAHSENDDFINIEVTRGIWEELSDNGKNNNVKFSTISHFDHATSTAVFLADVILRKHPYKDLGIISFEDIMGLFN